MPVDGDERGEGGGPGRDTRAAEEAARVRRAYEACAEITRRHARNFYYGLRLTPEPRRSALFAVYAWMRRADDIADDPAPTERRGAHLAAFGERTQRFLDGDPAIDGHDGEVFWPALADAARSYRIDHRVFADMLAGLEDDLTRTEAMTEAGLRRYCYRVASTVGLACVSIWGWRDGADATLGRELAIRRGQAFQRTNILRDFAEDFDGSPRRVYVPAEAFARHGLTPEELRHWRDEARCGALVLEQAAAARAEYDESAPLDSLVAEDCVPTLWAMTRIYRGLLDTIERFPRRVALGPRVRLSGARKAAIALSAGIRVRARGWPGVRAAAERA